MDSDKVQQAIEAFQPAWLPERDSLPRRLITVLHPSCGQVGAECGGAASKPQVCSRGDDLSLLTAEHLFHLVRVAGGVPILTRTDDRPAAGGAQAAEWLRGECETARCHVLVTIDAPGADGPHKAPGVRPIGEAEISLQLAEALAEATGLPVVLSELSTGLPVPAVSVTFSAADVEALQAGEAGGALHRRDAGATPSGATPTGATPTGATLSSDHRRDAGATPSGAAPAGAMPGRPIHQVHAAQIFQGLAAHAAARGEALERGRTRRWPQAQPPETVAIPSYPDDTPPIRQSRTAREIWPEGPLPPERADWFARMYRRISLSDRTNVYFEPQVTVENGVVVLGGATNVPILAESLEASLRAVGIEELRNVMRVLPEDSELGVNRFGVFVSTIARTFDLPSERSGVQTQLLFGEPVFLLDRRDGFLLVHADDGYWGWVREETIRVLGPEEFNRYTSGKLVVLVQEVQLDGNWIRAGSRFPRVSREGPVVRVLNPAGLRAPSGLAGSSALRTEVDAIMELPAGTVHVVDKSDRVRARLDAALAMLHTPYVFGGRSPLGLDCSGFVTNLFEQEGLPWARDAAQQFLSGKLVATRWHRDGIQAGDLVYFINPSGKISHTGMAISPTHFIHSSPPGVQINSLQKGDRLYRAHWDDTFFCAKRP